ncbi:hypothetical protein PYCCODRAFT_365062 [Trametes coccinea BRFM310]|uniref:Uncharacterized protein n=1 Tax=Trametes coccinea (strain BRFM310) TaxID=1353009 RepID=A0A1Y2J632_TRAC3|nr:hypothetical protein PYCCODRAFT_365062 [Trametes coccinea BRFM310]
MATKASLCNNLPHGHHPRQTFAEHCKPVRMDHMQRAVTGLIIRYDKIDARRSTEGGCSVVFCPKSWRRRYGRATAKSPYHHSESLPVGWHASEDGCTLSLPTLTGTRDEGGVGMWDGRRRRSRRCNQNPSCAAENYGHKSPAAYLLLRAL